MDALIAAFLHPALWVTAIVIGMLGEVAKKLVRAKAGDKGWRGVYYATYRAHAIVVGAGIGALSCAGIDLPVGEGFAEGAGPVLYYACSGALAMIGYDAIVKTIRKTLGGSGTGAGGGASD